MLEMPENRVLGKTNCIKERRIQGDKASYFSCIKKHWETHTKISQSKDVKNLFVKLSSCQIVFERSSSLKSY